jgi:hypothetical protein
MKGPPPNSATRDPGSNAAPESRIVVGAEADPRGGVTVGRGGSSEIAAAARNIAAPAATIAVVRREPITR